jgi:hypothetical protein
LESGAEGLTAVRGAGLGLKGTPNRSARAFMAS